MSEPTRPDVEAIRKRHAGGSITPLPIREAVALCDWVEHKEAECERLREALARYFAVVDASDNFSMGETEDDLRALLSKGASDGE